MFFEFIVCCVSKLPSVSRLLGSTQLYIDGQLVRIAVVRIKFDRL